MLSPRGSLVEEKSMVPTVVVGVGGTGAEVIGRIRRLIEETYGELNNFPIISFLLIDTDKDYQITNPEASGSQLKDYEKYWARVSGTDVEAIIQDLDNYPWINSWFPNELEGNITGLEAGAGQIRACGRFAFFFNYHKIQKKFVESLTRVKGKETYMQNNYGIKVTNNSTNIFVTGSLSGGTGSGMLIDLGYALRHWLKGEGSALTTGIVPTPQAFAAIDVGDRVLANGYAAMMELSYFSDDRTNYIAQFSNSLNDEIRSTKAPFDFTYLVGTKNGESDFKLDEIREMIAQNIFLDMTSDFAPHKRSIRDNIKSSWAEKDPGGRGYSKQFMSFGLSSIEIPVAHIRTSLSYRLAQNFVNWWLNEEAILPPQIYELVRDSYLKPARLTPNELLADLASAEEGSYLEVISQWVNQLSQEIEQQNWLECTHKGANMFGSEKGKILRFVDEYLRPKVNSYRADHFRELSPDERLHGDYLQKIYSNRDRAIKHGQESLETEFYSILEDRTRGPKYADSFIVIMRQLFDDAKEKFRRDQEKVWTANENNRLSQYEGAIKEINELKDKFALSKPDKINQYSQQALQGLEGSLIATIQRKTRAVAVQVIEVLQLHLNRLESRFQSWQQRLIIARDIFNQQSSYKADSANALKINGIKLYDRQELNLLYDDFLERLAGETSTSNKNLTEVGLDKVCSNISSQVLAKTSPLWKEERRADEIMRLLDITSISEVQEEDFRKIILTECKNTIQKAPENSRIKTELAACDRLLKTYNDEQTITNNIRIAYNKSKPLLILSSAVMQGEDAGFSEAKNQNIAILGGKNTANPAAQKILPKLQQFIQNEDNIKPLGEPERHRIIFVQEIGGFSLRCIEGMRQLRQSYLTWKGNYIQAKRDRQAGKSRDLPIPVHLQKEPPFWDIFPEDQSIYNLVIQARALNVLTYQTNQKTRENVIRYTRQTVIGAENVDLAASWEEVVSVLQIKACRSDREEVEQQVNQQINSCETDSQKQRLYEKLLKYLEQRGIELLKEKKGGKDAPEYKREAKIIQNLIESQKLNVTPITSPSNAQSAQETVNDKLDKPIQVFCNQCGKKNPPNSKFCSACGHKLV